MLVKDFLGKKSKKGHQGLELEVEAEVELPQIKDDYWTTKAEGSLMGSNGRPGYGIEYVSNGPQDITSAAKGIRSLCWELGQKKYKVLAESPRTSFHVHSNVLNHTPVQYWTGVSLYWLVEPLLFDFCAPNRKGNAFCLTLADAEGVLPYVFKDLRAPLPFGNLATDAIRYSSQNLAATTLHGTVEVRGMDGKIDAPRMEAWSSALHAIYEKAAKDFKSPSDMLQTYEKRDARDFLSRLFGDEFSAKLTLKGDWRDKLLESATTLAELSYFHDWDRWYTNIQANAKKDGVAKIKYDGDMPITATAGRVARPTRFTANLTLE